jgi:hypothetical protein
MTAVRINEVGETQVLLIIIIIFIVVGCTAQFGSKPSLPGFSKTLFATSYLLYVLFCSIKSSGARGSVVD